MRASEFITEVKVRVRLKKIRPGTYYKGYRCTKDCSGHQAGYKWSKAKGIKNRVNCPANVHNSFREGCWSWTEKK